jgi:hypothetical protein
MIMIVAVLVSSSARSPATAAERQARLTAA